MRSALFALRTQQDSTTRVVLWFTFPRAFSVLGRVVAEKPSVTAITEGGCIVYYDSVHGPNQAR